MAKQWQEVGRGPENGRIMVREINALCETARWCSARGWVPATSGNFSVRDKAAERIFISPSGLDKGAMKPADLLEMDAAGKVVRGKGKPSAETELHRVIYGVRQEAGAILHVHTVWNTLISEKLARHKHVRLKGYELLKALDGVGTHEYEERIPLLANTQDYAELAERMEKALRWDPLAHGVLLRGHGLYTWGKTVADARRHLDALEFLFEVEGRKLFGE